MVPIPMAQYNTLNCATHLIIRYRSEFSIHSNIVLYSVSYYIRTSSVQQNLWQRFFVCFLSLKKIVPKTFSFSIFIFFNFYFPIFSFIINELKYCVIYTFRNGRCKSVRKNQQKKLKIIAQSVLSLCLQINRQNRKFAKFK